MNLLFFASFITFGFWLTYQLWKSRKLNEKAGVDFWENETMANNVRKKPINESDYVCFAFEKLPSADSFLPNSAPESLCVLQSLSEKKMINLNGISNTEVKKRFGVANLPILSEYDENFERLVRHLYLLCQELYDNGRMEESRILLEEGVKVGTDSLSHYKLLARIYRENGRPEELSRLRSEAKKLRSLTKNAILRELSAKE